MQSTENLAAQVLDDPLAAADLSPADTTAVLAKLLMATVTVLTKWAQDGEAEQAAKARASGDRLLTTKEMAIRLGRTVPTLTRGWKEGRYPFILKDGGRLVGSEDGLERWIKNRTTRRA